MTQRPITQKEFNDIAPIILSRLMKKLGVATKIVRPIEIVELLSPEAQLLEVFDSNEAAVVARICGSRRFYFDISRIGRLPDNIARGMGFRDISKSLQVQDSWTKRTRFTSLIDVFSGRRQNRQLKYVNSAYNLWLQTSKLQLSEAINTQLETLVRIEKSDDKYEAIAQLLTDIDLRGIKNPEFKKLFTEQFINAGKRVVEKYQGLLQEINHKIDGVAHTVSSDYIQLRDKGTSLSFNSIIFQDLDTTYVQMPKANDSLWGTQFEVIDNVLRGERRVALLGAFDEVLDEMTTQEIKTEDDTPVSAFDRRSILGFLTGLEENPNQNAILKEATALCNFKPPVPGVSLS